MNKAEQKKNGQNIDNYLNSNKYFRILQHKA